MTAGAELLVELLKPGRLTSVVDVGLGPITQQPLYGAMLGKRLCSVVGLTPRIDERMPPSALRSDLERHLPYLAGDGAVATLRLCESPGMNSPLAPNPQVLNCFPLFAGMSRVIGECPVETRRLDEIAEIASLDFLKIDVQGSETAVFGGGGKRLSEAVAVQTEVCFMELYKGQALFADIDEALHAHGFIPHIFNEVSRVAIEPLFFAHDPYRTFNHGAYCDIVYVRDFSRAGAMSVEQLKHLALIAHYCFRSFDLTLRCMEELEKRKAITPADIDSYMGSFKGGNA